MHCGKALKIKNQKIVGIMPLRTFYFFFRNSTLLLSYLPISPFSKLEIFSFYARMHGALGAAIGVTIHFYAGFIVRGFNTFVVVIVDA